MKSAVLRIVIGLLVLLGAGAMRSAAAETFVVKTNYYTVGGSTLQELQLSQQQRRPWKTRFAFAARTDWNVNWNFELAHDGERFRVGGLDIRTEVKVVLPRWVPPEGADAAVVRRWNRYVQNLATHENGHVELARQAMAELVAQVYALPSYASAAELRNAARQTGRTVEEKFRRRDREYDRKTGHGATQGAFLSGAPEP